MLISYPNYFQRLLHDVRLSLADYYFIYLNFSFWLQSRGFGGLWRFAGPFTKANNNAENVELFNNALEALVETCLPVDEAEEARYVLLTIFLVALDTVNSQIEAAPD